MQSISCFIVVIVCLVNSNANAKDSLTVGHLELLALHNAYRQSVKYGKVAGQPPAASMAKLIWSYELANVSKSLAKKCQPYPNSITMRGKTRWTYVGQNVAVVAAIRDAAARWFSEHSNYNFEANVCRQNRQCANYKQMVYSETTHIGCAYKLCDNFKAPFNILVVCTYGPGGKYFSRRPYTPWKHSLDDLFYSQDFY
uniref:SCP domain-containing protein n=1 Tax=Trichobilharzia regenti TaxID=157069 RepID=A0AA85J404_TRIRE|nr:unnamed protein product [Trichobilharzia regenti]